MNISGLFRIDLIVNHMVFILQPDYGSNMQNLLELEI